MSENFSRKKQGFKKFSVGKIYRLQTIKLQKKIPSENDETH